LSNPNPDPFLRPSFPLSNRLLRFVWSIASAVLFRPSPRPCHAWRNLVLRAFGAKLAPNTRIYSKAQIWAPWNLICGQAAAIADEAVIYNPKPIYLGSHTIVSQQAYLCGASHDYEDPGFPLIAYPMTLGDYSWICSRATVMPGVNVGDGAVLALGSVATHDLKPWTVYGGVPARKIKDRVLRAQPQFAAVGG